MKKYLIILLSLTVSSTLLSQNITFDDSLTSPHINIDTINNINNIWQIAQPQKTLFNSAYTPPNAIITEPVNNYPTNDSSSFYLWHTGHQFPGYWPTLKFQFKIDSDSLNDFGIIEVSPDKGQSWINVISEAQNYNLGWWVSQGDTTWGDIIPFTGTSSNWMEFNLEMMEWDNSFGYSDSILFRFSFLSDSLETNQNGWIIDNIIMGDYYLSINEVPLTIQSQVFPNPSTDWITIRFENRNSMDFDLTITDEKGQIVQQSHNIKQSEIKLNITTYNAGIYFYNLTDNDSNKQAKGTFVKK